MEKMNQNPPTLLSDLSELVPAMGKTPVDIAYKSVFEQFLNHKRSLTAQDIPEIAFNYI